MEKVADLPWNKESFNGITAEVCQRGIVEIRLNQRVLCEERPPEQIGESGPARRCSYGPDVPLGAALHDSRIIGKGVEGEQVAQKG